MAPVHGYWKIRGLAHPIRLLHAYTGTEYEDKVYECGPAPDFDRSSWFDEKEKLGLDFPNLPYYIDGDLKLTQSGAILRHVARKHDLVGSTEEEKAKVDMMENQLSDLKSSATHLCYNPKFDELKSSFLTNLPKDLKLLSNYLGKQQFIVGDSVTYADFIAYAYLELITALQEDVLEGFSNLKDYKARVAALPAIATFLKSSEAAKYPFNNKSAKFGGQ